MAANGSFAILAVVLGLFVGSFVGVLVARIPEGDGVVRGRSRCDVCASPLRPRHLVPVVSWLALRGRCAICGAQVTPLWIALELATGALFGLALVIAPDGWAFGLLAPFFAVLLALTAIDLRTFRLPDAIVFPSSSSALLLITASTSARGSLSLLSALLGSVAFAGPLLIVYVLVRRVYREDGMGLGDVKLAALIGLVVGAFDLASVAVAAGVAILLGGVVGLLALAMGAGRRARIPFGPMLCVGAVAATVAGPRLFQAYLGFFM